MRVKIIAKDSAAKLQTEVNEFVDTLTHKIISIDVKTTPIGHFSVEYIGVIVYE